MIGDPEPMGPSRFDEHTRGLKMSMRTNPDVSLRLGAFGPQMNSAMGPTFKSNIISHSHRKRNVLSKLQQATAESGVADLKITNSKSRQKNASLQTLSNKYHKSDSDSAHNYDYNPPLLMS